MKKEDFGDTRTEMEDHPQSQPGRERADSGLPSGSNGLEKLFNAVGEVIFFVRMPDRVIERANRMVESTFGYSEKELVGNPTSLLYENRSSYEDFGRKLSRAIAKGEKLLETEHMLRRKNGETFLGNVTTSFIFEEGALTYVISVVRDITKFKQTEEELRTEKEFADSIINTAQAIVLLLDPNGRIVTFNPYMEALCGYKLEEVKGRDWFDTFLPAPNRTATRELFGTAIEDIPTRGNIDVILTRDGKKLLIEWYDKTLKDKNGRITGLLSIGQDVTERERSRKELLTSEERFRLVFNNATDGILITDAETRKLINANRAMCELLGYSLGELTELSVEDIHPSEVVEELKNVFAQQVQGESSFGEAIKVKRKDGSIFSADIGGSSMVYDGRLVFLASFRDVTEKRELQAQLAQADRLSSMGMLAAGVAHEINNPLTYILYNLESLSEDLPELLTAMRQLSVALDDPTDAGAVEEVAAKLSQKLNVALLDDIFDRFGDALAGTRRIREIARGLGTFSRVEKEQLVPVNLTHVIEVALNLAYNEIKYRARLVKDYGKVPTVLASEGRLSQVFLNLIINAVHAVEEGDVEGNEIRVRTWAEGENVFAEVRDTGSGIPPENLAKLFDPFFTTKKIGAGSGLGLAISKNIVQSYCGEISVESEVGKGTCFTIRLPVRNEDAESRKTPSEPATAPKIPGRVLVIDDEEGIRASMVRMLRGHEAIQASSGADALALLKNDQAFDLILCDMMMSEISGMEVHQWLKKENPALAKRLIFITGGAFTPRARDYLTKVDNLRIEKPFDVTNFKKIVNDRIQMARSAEPS